jgi:ABC-type antimicrobial peptide transport system permease subunit
LTLSVVGVFSVFMSMLEERRRDIGVRLALGADRADVVSAMFVATGLPIVVGVGGGLVLSLASGAALQSYLVGVPRTDVVSYALAVAVLISTVAIATFIPLRRALRIDPAVTLRQE